MISVCGKSAGAVIPVLGSGRYSPGPNIVLPSWLKGSDPHFTINGCWGQPGALATVSKFTGVEEGLTGAPARATVKGHAFVRGDTPRLPLGREVMIVAHGLVDVAIMIH